MVSLRNGVIFRLALISILLLGVSLAAGSLAYRALAEQQMPPTPPRPIQRDVTYCTEAGVALKLDIYARGGRSQGPPSPAVIFVHGGAWSSGDKAGGEGTPEIEELAGRGYLVVSINYRLAPAYVFPAQIHDVKCAVRYLRANAASLDSDPGRIGAWGASAGGHLVSLLGTTDATAGMEGDGGYSGQSSRVQAVVDMYGRADLTTKPATRLDLLPVFGEANLITYSPITYASRPRAPRSPL